MYYNITGMYYKIYEGYFTKQEVNYSIELPLGKFQGTDLFVLGACCIKYRLDVGFYGSSYINHAGRFLIQQFIAGDAEAAYRNFGKSCRNCNSCIVHLLITSAIFASVRQTAPHKR